MKRLRADDGWLTRLSLVAVADDALLGHVVCTRGYVDDRPALGLGPISVLPDRQRAGIGHALLYSVLGAADATDETLVCVLGDPAFYRRFGFQVASELGWNSPVFPDTEALVLKAFRKDGVQHAEVPPTVPGGVPS